MKLCCLALAGCIACLGCGGGGETNAAASTSGSGGNNAGSGGSSTGGSGAMGGGGGTGTAGAGTGGEASDGSGGTGAGGFPNDPCPNAGLTISTAGFDPPLVMEWSRACPNSHGSDETGHALAYEGYTSGQPGAAHELFIEACEAHGTGRITMQVPLFDVGSSPTDKGQYQQSGATWKTTHDESVTVTAFGDVHQTIDGSFTGTMADSTGNHRVSGGFSLCRVSDFLPP